MLTTDQHSASVLPGGGRERSWLRAGLAAPIAVLVWLLAAGIARAADRIYWTNFNFAPAISFTNLDGTRGSLRRRRRRNRVRQRRERRPRVNIWLRWKWRRGADHGDLTPVAPEHRTWLGPSPVFASRGACSDRQAIVCVVVPGGPPTIASPSSGGVRGSGFVQVAQTNLSERLVPVSVGVGAHLQAVAVGSDVRDPPAYR